MNNLIASWHRADDVGVAEHLSQAHLQLLDKPGLETALAMVDAALAEVEAWAGQESPCQQIPTVKK